VIGFGSGVATGSVVVDGDGEVVVGSVVVVAGCVVGVAVCVGAVDVVAVLGFDVVVLFVADCFELVVVLDV
jgi:hypothetical protein